MRKTPFIRAFSVLICLAVMVLAGGCGKRKEREIMLYDTDTAENEKKTSITFFGYKADAMNLTAMETAMQSFMAKNSNISVTYEGIKGLAYWEAFDKRDESGMLDDVFMMHHDHLISMKTEGKLADLSELPGIENYSDRPRIQFTDPDGSVYFLPISISTYNLYINYDLLGEHGLTVPENWEEFKQVCDHFVNDGIVPVVANNRNSLTTLIISKGLFDVYQRPDVDEVLESFNSDPALLSDALASGVEQTADMISRGWFDTAEVLATEQTSDDLEIFVKGGRPFMISGGWASQRLMAMGPSFTYGVHPYPIIDDGSVLSFQVDTCISVNANSKHLEEAKKFVSYLIEPDVMWDFCDSQASYTPIKDDRTPSEKTLVPSTEYLTNGRNVMRNEYRLELPVETALSACAGSLLNGGTADEAKAILYERLSA